MPPQRLFVLIAGNFFVATSFLSVGGLLSDISASLQIPVEKAGLLIAAFGIAAAICAPTLATLGSRIERRKLLTTSMAICALGECVGFSQSDLPTFDVGSRTGGRDLCRLYAAGRCDVDRCSRPRRSVRRSWRS